MPKPPMLRSDQVQALAISLKESAFLRGKREDAYAVLEVADPKKLDVLSFPADLSFLDVPESEVTACGLPEEAVKAGVVFDIFANAWKCHEQIIEQHFRQLLFAHDSLEAARHFAFLTRAFLLYVPANADLKLPLTITVRCDAPWSAQHLVAVVGSGARVTIVERMEGGKSRPLDEARGKLRGNEAGFLSHACELFVGHGAEVEFTTVQALGAEVKTWIAQRSRVGENAKIHWANATLGASEAVQDLRSHITGEHALSAVDWLSFASGEQIQRLHVRNVFDAPAGGGEITVKGVAQDRAHTVVKGMIEITGNGAGTNTYLTETTLMLDPTAKCDAIPALEIKTNDVKASHSATVTKVNEEDLFYFGSRGIPHGEARRMFIDGFLGSLVPRFPKWVREDLLTAIHRVHGRR